MTSDPAAGRRAAGGNQKGIIRPFQRQFLQPVPHERRKLPPVGRTDDPERLSPRQNNARLLLFRGNRPVAQRGGNALGGVSAVACPGKINDHCFHPSRASVWSDPHYGHYTINRRECKWISRKKRKDSVFSAGRKNALRKKSFRKQKYRPPLCEHSSGNTESMVAPFLLLHW